MNKKEDIKTENNTYIITAPVVYKEFPVKNKKVTGHTEMYIRRSTQDYFIKFCESKISREELEKHISDTNKSEGNLNETNLEMIPEAITLEVEFCDGHWDYCDDHLMQTRTGEYVIIHKIIKNKNQDR